jgi:hypothetical protein
MKHFKHHIVIFVFILLVTAILFPQTSSACGLTDPMGCVNKVVAGIFNVILMPIAGSLLYLAGILLNVSIDFNLSISNIVQNVPAIEIAWKTIRDLISMFFIFILLYISIKTVLGLESNSRKLIIGMVIGGLLINFSLFFTKVIIDASNVVAAGFYNAMPHSNDITQWKNQGLSGLFMQRLKIQTVYKTYDPSNSSDVKPVDNTGVKFVDVIIMGFMNVLLTLIAAFVFFAAAILFMIRIGMLIFLMALSPVAFAGFILPETKKYASKWWTTLINQSIFAPIYLGLTYIAVKIISDDNFSKALGVTENQSFAAGITKSGALFLNYGIVIIFFMAALLAAQEFGAVGASTVQGWSKGLQKWGTNKLKAGGKAIGAGAYTNTMGRLASKVSTSEGFKTFAAKSIFGDLALKGVQKAGAGYDSKLQRQIKSRTDRAEVLGYDKQAYMAEQQKLYDLQVARNNDRIQNGMSEKDLDIKYKGQMNRVKDRMRELKVERKKQYAERIGSGILGKNSKLGQASTLFTKVARRNKVAAAKLNIDVLKSRMEKLEGDIKDDKAEFKALEREERKRVLTPEEQIRYSKLRDDIGADEEELGELKINVARLENLE